MQRRITMVPLRRGPNGPKQPLSFDRNQPSCVTKTIKPETGHPANETAPRLPCLLIVRTRS